MMASCSIFLFEHDLFGKPLHTFPDHALSFCSSMIVSENRSTLPDHALGWLPDRDDVGSRLAVFRDRLVGEEYPVPVAMADHPLDRVGQEPGRIRILKLKLPGPLQVNPGNINRLFEQSRQRTVHRALLCHRTRNAKSGSYFATPIDLPRYPSKEFEP